MASPACRCLALGLLLCEACGGLTGLSGDGGTDSTEALADQDAAVDEGPAPALSLEEYCQRRITFQCAYFVSCCTPAEFDETGVSCSSDFIERQTEYCLSLFEPALEAGSLVFDNISSASCIGALEAMVQSCPNFTVYFHRTRELHLEFCRDVFSGLVPAGGSCRIDQECLDGFCLIPEDGNEGACRAWIGMGEYCAENLPCGPGSACISGRCAPMGAEGDPCDATSDLTANDCGSGLWCDEGACALLLETGLECRSPAACQGSCSEDSDPPLCMDFCNGL